MIHAASGFEGHLEYPKTVYSRLKGHLEYIFETIYSILSALYLFPLPSVSRYDNIHIGIGININTGYILIQDILIQDIY